MKNRIQLQPGNRWQQMLIVPLVAVALIATSLPSVAAAKNPNPGILPINSTAHGKTYGEWSAAWWQWALSIPEAQNPLLDTTGAYAGVNQSGPVWFLAGTLGGDAERTIAIPSGKTIFMPVHNWIFGSAVFDCDPTNPGVTCDVPTLRGKAATAVDGVSVLEVSIDGTAVKDVSKYRAVSPEAFPIMYPEGALFGLNAGVYYPQVSDGYWLMLTPFAASGLHTIKVHVVNEPNGIDMHLVLHLVVGNN